MTNQVCLIEFDPDHTAELILLWRNSFQKAVGITDPHPLEEQHAYFQREVLPNNSVKVARLNGQIIGFIAASKASISQFYIHPDFQRQGIGSQLLNWAKIQSQGSLWLFTFAQNVNACRFYESQGFQEIARGFEPTWQLEDIKYEWHS